MKIKHFAGYGSVNAFKESKSANRLVIKVVGNHEYGLDRHDDSYDVFNWLVKRFDKNRTDYRDIESVGFEYCDDEYIDGVRTEAARYFINFRKREPSVIMR